MPAPPKQTLRFGPFQLDPQCAQLRRNGVGLKLQGQPIQILAILLEKPGDLVTRDELRQRLWPSDTFVDFDHSLNTAIKKLRQTLGDEADMPKYVETLPKRGYRFIAELDAADSDESQPSGPGDSVTEPRAIMRRTRWIGSAALFALTLIALLAGVYWAIQAPPMPRVVGSHALTKSPYPKKWSDQGRLVTDGTYLYFQEVRDGQVTTMEVPVAGGSPLELATTGREFIGLRDISKDGSELLLSILDPTTQHYDAWIQPLPTGAPRLIVQDARWPLWTSDGLGMLFSRRDKDLYRINTDGTGLQLLRTFPDISGLALSPDGGRIRFTDYATGTIWEAGSDGSNPRRVLTDEKDGMWVGTWSSDGKYFFFLGWDGDRFNLWVASEEHHWWRKPPPPRQLTFGPLSMWAPALSKDGRQIYAVASASHGELSVYDSKIGQFIPYMSGISACYLDFSKDGQFVAYVSYPEGTLWRGRLDGTDQRQLTIPPMGVIHPRWSPDGKLIAFEGRSGGERRNIATASRIYVISAEGGGPMLLPTGDQGASDPTWSPDGSAIAYASGRGPTRKLLIFNLATQKKTELPGSAGYWSPRWSPNGKSLVAMAGNYPNKLAVFSFATQTWRDLPVGHFNFPKWSQDSRYIYAIRGSSAVVRIRVADAAVEPVASLAGFSSTAYGHSTWLGLTPDSRLIMTRETGMSEIYAFDLDYK